MGGVKIELKMISLLYFIPCRLNILVLGGNAGLLELYAYGMYKIASLTDVRLLCSFTSVVLYIFQNISAIDQ